MVRPELAGVAENLLLGLTCDKCIWHRQRRSGEREACDGGGEVCEVGQCCARGGNVRRVGQGALLLRPPLAFCDEQEAVPVELAPLQRLEPRRLREIGHFAHRVVVDSAIFAEPCEGVEDLTHGRENRRISHDEPATRMKDPLNLLQNSSGIR